MGKLAVIDGDDFVFGEEETGIDSALDGVCYEGGFHDWFHG